jgi:pantothenate kinase type III
MGEFASKGVAGSGLGLGIAGTALGLLNNNGNLLGGILGGGCQNQVSMLQSENAMLKAEKYSDQNIAAVYTALRNETQALQDRIFDKYIAPISQEIADMRVREARTDGRIGEVSLLAQNGLTALQGQVNCLAQTVAGITKTVVPITAVCPNPMPQFNSWTAPTAPTTTG